MRPPDVELWERSTVMPDYDWSYETSDGQFADRTPEDWLRDTWEEGPKFLRVFLPLAWRYGLGLRLASRSDPSAILGWHIADASPDAVTVDAVSRIMRAENIVAVERGALRWRTTVDFENIVGRMVWWPASIVHQLLVPTLVRRAGRRRAHDERQSMS